MGVEDGAQPEALSRQEIQRLVVGKLNGLSKLLIKDSNKPFLANQSRLEAGIKLFHLADALEKSSDFSASIMIETKDNNGDNVRNTTADSIANSIKEIIEKLFSENNLSECLGIQVNTGLNVQYDSRGNPLNSSSNIVVAVSIPEQVMQQGGTGQISAEVTNTPPSTVISTQAGKTPTDGQSSVVGGEMEFKTDAQAEPTTPVPTEVATVNQETSVTSTDLLFENGDLSPTTPNNSKLDESMIVTDALPEEKPPEIESKEDSDSISNRIVSLKKKDGIDAELSGALVIMTNILNQSKDFNLNQKILDGFAIVTNKTLPDKIDRSASKDDLKQEAREVLLSLQRYLSQLKEVVKA